MPILFKNKRPRYTPLPSDETALQLSGGSIRANGVFRNVTDVGGTYLRISESNVISSGMYSNHTNVAGTSLQLTTT